MTRPVRLIGLLLAVLSLSCAIGPGEPFATVSPALDARYVVPGDRIREDGFARLASDYELRLIAASISLGHFEVTTRPEGGGGSGGATFDPANPPPGYSLCHGGHCHRDDGALIPYEEIAAELEGGSGNAPKVAMTLQTERTVDLLAGLQEPVQCVPDCGLDRGEVTGVRGEVRHLRLEGVVRDSRSTPRMAERSFLLDATFAEGATDPGALLAAPLSLRVDRRQFPSLAVSLDVHPGPRLFDAVDWAAIPDGDDVLVLSAEAHPDIREALLDAFATHSFEVQVTRSP